jgi:hypothetical protein
MSPADVSSKTDMLFLSCSCVCSCDDDGLEMMMVMMLLPILVDKLVVTCSCHSRPVGLVNVRACSTGDTRLAPSCSKQPNLALPPAFATAQTYYM